MEYVTFRRQCESIRLNEGRLRELFEELGDAGAHDVVCRAMEEIATRLAFAATCHRENRMREMRKSVRSLIAIADQLGMPMLAQVSQDVLRCHDYGDRTALAAVTARLLRVGEWSLSEIWDLQELSSI